MISKPKKYIVFASVIDSQPIRTTICQMKIANQGGLEMATR